jgi:hypothetical protein
MLEVQSDLYSVRAFFIPGLRCTSSRWEVLPDSGKPYASLASRLVRDAGFEPVVVGPLSRAKDFDYGTVVYTRALTARELRHKLGID